MKFYVSSRYLPWENSNFRQSTKLDSCYLLYTKPSFLEFHPQWKCQQVFGSEFTTCESGDDVQSQTLALPAPMKRRVSHTRHQSCTLRGENPSEPKLMLTERLCGTRALRPRWAFCNQGGWEEPPPGPCEAGGFLSETMLAGSTWESNGCMHKCFSTEKRVEMLPRGPAMAFSIILWALYSLWLPFQALKHNNVTQIYQHASATLAFIGWQQDERVFIYWDLLTYLCIERQSNREGERERERESERASPS